MVSDIFVIVFMGLQVAGTIVTYELVLYQFYTGDEKPETLCAKKW